MRGDGYGPMGRGSGRGGYGEGPWMHDGMGWGGWFLMTLFLLLLVALIVGVVIALVRSTGSRGSQSAPAMGGSASAQQMLDERYARGEIDEIEYLHRRAVLRGS